MNIVKAKTGAKSKHGRSAYPAFHCKGRGRICAAFALLAALVASSISLSGAEDKPKAALKDPPLLIVQAGHTLTVTLYADNLTPKTVTVNKPPLRVKLVEARPTEGEAKKRGGVQITLALTAPADCPRAAYVLTFDDGRDDGKPAKKAGDAKKDEKEAEAKVTRPVAVVDETATELDVKKPNATFAQAMPLAGSSVAVRGALDNDAPALFQFEAKAGETWDISLVAGRAGSELDALLRLRDTRHTALALSAGDPKKDRRLLFRAPKDGTYTLEILEAEGKGGPAYAYRLTLVKKPETPARAGN